MFVRVQTPLPLLLSISGCRRLASPSSGNGARCLNTLAGVRLSTTAFTRSLLSCLSQPEPSRQSFGRCFADCLVGLPESLRIRKCVSRLRREPGGACREENLPHGGPGHLVHRGGGERFVRYWRGSRSPVGIAPTAATAASRTSIHPSCTTSGPTRTGDQNPRIGGFCNSPVPFQGPSRQVNAIAEATESAAPD